MVAGVAPVRVARTLSLVHKSLDAAGSQQCTTAAISVTLGMFRDLAATVPCQIVLNWAAIMARCTKRVDETRGASRRLATRLQRAGSSTGKGWADGGCATGVEASRLAVA